MIAAADSATREREATIPAVLIAAAERDPEAVYLIDGETEHSFAAVARKAESLRGRFASLGVGRGERVVLWMPNGVEWVASFFAVLGLGGIVVPAGTRLRVEDLRQVLAGSEARVLVFSPRFLGIDFDAMVAELLPSGHASEPAALQHVVAASESAIEGAESLRGLEWAAAEPEPLAACASDRAIACYTSGSTGRPKGCVHTHAALVENARIAARLSGLSPGERIACPVPFAHVFGFHMGVLQAAIAGATLINAEPFDPEDFLDICKERRATVAYEVPTMAREVVAAQARDPRPLELRLSLIAGAPVSATLRRQTEHLISDGVGVAYGCTEAPTISQLLPSDPMLAWEESVGRPTPGVEVLIVRPGTEEALPAGDVGEILVRGYNTMDGYLGDPEGTRRKFRHGWLVTGDLGSLDAAGFLRVAGRADDTLLVGGFNAYPREIEAQLETLEGVDEVVVISVPDARLGQVPMAWVTASSDALDSTTVLTWSRRHLASYKRPRYVRVVRHLPRLDSGKIARTELARAARSELPHLPWEGEAP